MIKLIKIYLIFSAILYPLIFISKFYDYEMGEKILVPLFVSMVLIFSCVFNPPKKNHNIYLCIAFLFVCAGDFIVNLTNWGGWFIVPFVLVHIFLIIYFSKEKNWSSKDVKILLFIILPISIIHFLSLPLIEKLSFRIVFVLYSYLLSTMLWRAICFAQTKNDFIQKFLTISGALLFLVTDMSVALNIVLQTKILIAITWICYVPALVMLSIMKVPLRKYN